MRGFKKLLVAGLIFVGVGVATSRGSILLDFGPTTVSGTTDEGNSPGHATGAVSATDLTWNHIVANDASIVNGDGSTAAGVSVTLGLETSSGSGNIGFSSPTFNVTGLTGSSFNPGTGIFLNTAPAKDGIFANGTNGSNSIAAAVRIDGLPAGIYTTYSTDRNTNTSTLGDTAREYLTAGATATTLANYASLSNFADVTNSTNATFIQGDNYQSLTTTITAGQSLYFVSQGTFTGTNNELRGFLNSLEIVATPEPGSLGLILTCVSGLLIRRRRTI